VKATVHQTVSVHKKRQHRFHVEVTDIAHEHRVHRAEESGEQTGARVIEAPPSTNASRQVACVEQALNEDPSGCRRRAGKPPR